MTTEPVMTEGMCEEADTAESKRLAAMPIWLRAIAEQHSLPLFDICFNALAATERLTLMSQKIRAAEAQQNLQVVAQSMDNIAKVALGAMGKGLGDFHACCKDIQQACALAAHAPEQAAGRIILPH